MPTKNMTPAFRHMGGKARLRKWIVGHFPDERGAWYIEPFAGKGNVYFLARQTLNYSAWVLGDIDVEFLRAIKFANLAALPDSVPRNEFSRWKTASEDRSHPDYAVAKLIEPRITYAGKGYAAGYSGHSGTHVGYSAKHYRPVCESARLILESALIVTGDWKHVLEDFRFDADDKMSLVYLDPPYYGTLAPYPQIDHVELIKYLNSAKFAWALSGYRNDLYDAHLEFACRFEYERNSEIKSSNSGKREPVTETLWTNYEL